MTSKAVTFFRKKFEKTFKGKYSEQSYEEYLELKRFIKKLDEDDSNLCLQEYLNVYSKPGYNDNGGARTIFQDLIFRILDTSTDLTRLNKLMDQVNNEKSIINQRVRQIIEDKLSDPELKNLMKEIKRKYAEAENRIKERYPERTKVSSSRNTINALTPLWKSFVGANYGRDPKTINELFIHKPKEEKEHRLTEHKNWYNERSNLKNITQIQKALRDHRDKIYDDPEYPFFKILSWFRVKNDFHLPLFTEFYLQLVSQLIIDRPTQTRTYSAFDKDELEFFLGPIRKNWKTYFTNYQKRFEEIYRSYQFNPHSFEGGLRRAFDDAAFAFLSLRLLATSRSVDLISQSQITKYSEDREKLAKELERIRAKHNLKSAKNRQSEYFSIYSPYDVIRNQNYYVGQKIYTSTKDFIAIIAINKDKDLRLQNIWVVYSDISFDIPFSMSPSVFEQYAFARLASQIARNTEIIRMIGKFLTDPITLRIIGYGLSLFTGGASSLFFDIAYDCLSYSGALTTLEKELGIKGMTGQGAGESFSFFFNLSRGKLPVSSARRAAVRELEHPTPVVPQAGKTMVKDPAEVQAGIGSKLVGGTATEAKLAGTASDAATTIDTKLVERVKGVSPMPQSYTQNLKFFQSGDAKMLEEVGKSVYHLKDEGLKLFVLNNQELITLGKTVFGLKDDALKQFVLHNQNKVVKDLIAKKSLSKLGEVYGLKDEALESFIHSNLPHPPLAAKQVLGQSTSGLQKSSPVGHYGIDQYGRFNYPARTIDQLEGHELLSNEYLQARGFGQRLSSNASRQNPAIGLTEIEHKAVSAQQTALFAGKDIMKMDPVEVIELNEQAMKLANAIYPEVNIPEYAIKELKKASLRHADRFGLLSNEVKAKYKDFLTNRTLDLGL